MKIKYILLLLLLVLMVCVPSESHDWYSMACCGGEDCGPITKKIDYLNGDMYIVINTLNGETKTAVFPKNFPIEPSQDERMHACIIFGNKPRCLYMPAGV